MLMVMFLLVIGLMVKLMEMDYSSLNVEPNIQDNGKKISCKDKGRKHGLMEQFTKVRSKMEKSMEKEFLY